MRQPESTERYDSFIIGPVPIKKILSVNLQKVIKINSFTLINFCSQTEDHVNCKSLYWLLSSHTKAKVMMMMQYINCVVKAHKTQTIKLALILDHNDMSYVK